MVEAKSKKFQRCKEDFQCEHCGISVVGNGYTNHCPKCLWSKHVDVLPGDRLAVCQGMMEPLSLKQEGNGGYLLVHHCIKCGYEKRNKSAEEDDYESLLLLSRNIANK